MQVFISTVFNGLTFSEFKFNCLQFIDLNSVMTQEASSRQNARRIAERALRNVPWHLIAYMHKFNIAAKPPIQVGQSQFNFHTLKIFSSFKFLKSSD